MIETMCQIRLQLSMTSGIFDHSWPKQEATPLLPEKALPQLSFSGDEFMETYRGGPSQKITNLSLWTCSTGSLRRTAGVQSGSDKSTSMASVSCSDMQIATAWKASGSFVPELRSFPSLHIHGLQVPKKTSQRSHQGGFTEIQLAMLSASR